MALKECSSLNRIYSYERKTNDVVGVDGSRRC